MSDRPSRGDLGAFARLPFFLDVSCAVTGGFGVDSTNLNPPKMLDWESINFGRFRTFGLRLDDGIINIIYPESQVSFMVSLVHLHARSH